MLANLYQEAGLGHFAPAKLTFLFAIAIAAVGLTAIKLTGIVSFGLALGVFTSAAALEGLANVVRRRSTALSESLPQVIEALAAAVASGQDLSAALAAQAKLAPKALRKSFEEFTSRYESGQSLEACLTWLQSELANINSDQLVALLLVSIRRGGDHLVQNLQNLSQTIRDQQALSTEMAAKQGWVTGTAKLALMAPWFIVLLLSARPEAKAFYSSVEGSVTLMTGLAVCSLAYWMIVLAGRIPGPKRVFDVQS